MAPMGKVESCYVHTSLASGQQWIRATALEEKNKPVHHESCLDGSPALASELYPLELRKAYGSLFVQQMSPYTLLLHLQNNGTF
jgi:hypothetical protein